MAKGSPLGRLFGRSPITPIQQHMQLAEESVQLLCQMLSAAVAGDRGDPVVELSDLIAANRSRALELRRDIRDALPRGLLLAMPRPDLLALLDCQQRVCDAAVEVTRSIVLRPTDIPAPLAKSLERFCSHLADEAGQVLTAIRELDELIEQGFGDAERRAVVKLLDGAERQLMHCQRIHERLVVKLAQREADIAPLDAMFLYRLLDSLLAVAERSADVAEQLRLLLAR